MIHDARARAAAARPPANQLCAGAAASYGGAMINYEWRGQFENAEVNALHAAGFGHAVLADDWQAQLSAHSLGWVTARDGRELAGFVNLAWDGGVHAFLLDTLVAAGAQHRGIGTRLVALARDEARRAGCEWLHVDFEDDLDPFYFGSCGFTPTTAGLIALR
jgi:GNAT superfamily N-acetyltransferase